MFPFQHNCDGLWREWNRFPAPSIEIGSTLPQGGVWHMRYYYSEPFFLFWERSRFVQFDIVCCPFCGEKLAK